MKELTIQKHVSEMSFNDIFYLFDELKPKEWTDILKCRSPRFEAITQYHGELATKNLISICLSELCKNLSFNVTEDMIGEASKNIAQTFSDCKLSDLKLFKEFALTGKLTKELFRIDALVLFTMFETYYKYIRTHFAEYFEEKHEENKKAIIKGNETVRKAAPAWVKEKTIELEARLKRERREADANRPKPHESKTLIDLCNDQGVDIDKVLEFIRNEAETEFADTEIGITFETFLTMRTMAHTIEARKDPNYLINLISKQG